jgi:hypothetical protein
MQGGMFPPRVLLVTLCNWISGGFFNGTGVKPFYSKKESKERRKVGSFG